MRQEIILDYNIEEDSIYHPTKEVAQLFGVPQRIEHAQDYLIRYGVILPESAKSFMNLFRQIRGGAPHAECVVRAKTAKGELLWVELRLTTVYDEAQRPVRAVGTLKDITEQRENELQLSNNLLRREIMMREALIYYEADLTRRKVTFGLEQLFQQINMPYSDDYSFALDVLTNNLVYPEERAVVRSAFTVETLLESYARGERRVELEYRRLTGEGTVLWVRGSAYLSENDLSHNVMLCFYVSDINDQKLRELNLRERVERDALTGLYNKVTTELRIQAVVEADVAAGRQGALLLVGLNGFREVNRQHGSYFGDALLSELGHRLGAGCGPGEIAGRSGGVEFMVYLRNAGNAAAVVKRANHLCTALMGTEHSVLGEGGITLAVGVTLSPEHGDTYEALYRKAGIAFSTCPQDRTAVRVYRKGLHKSAAYCHRALENTSEQVLMENVVEHVFRTLYDTQDLDIAIQGVLELIVDAFGFHRGYVFDVESDGMARCVFECHAQGVSPILQERREMNREQVEEYSSRFERDEVYLVRPEAPKEGVALALRLLYCYRNAGELRGFVGFTRVGTDSSFSEDQLATLKDVLRLLGVFLAGRSVNRELSESSILLQSVVDGMHTCTYIIDPATHIIRYINQNTREAMPGAQPGRRCYEALRGKLMPCEDCPIDHMVHEGTTECHRQMFLGQFEKWARVNASLVTVPSGQIFGVFHSFDFSEQPHEEENQEQLLSDFTHDASLYDALSMSTDDYIIMCDMATRRFYFPKKMVEEFELPAQVIVDAIPVWAEHIHKDDREDFMADINAMFSGQTDTHNQEYRAKNRNGEWVWLRAKGHVERSKDGSPTLFAVVLTNLGKKSKVDHLTGLLDKYEFEVSTRAALADGISQGVLLILGLDNFRYINNIYGWDFGDQVLKESSLRLLSTLRENIQLYRLDGDKFGAFFPGADAVEVEEYFRSLHHVFRQHRQFEGHRYYCTISGGCTYFKGDSTSFGALYKQATYALDMSKREGKNRLTIYDAQTMGGSERMLALMSALHESVERGCENFEVYYQPQVESGTCRVRSAEALLRWHNEELGMVSPAEFIPLLEQTGLIHRVGRWVLQKSADVCKKWRETNPDFTVSVNLSFVQLQDQSFMSYLTHQVKTGQIVPEMLHLEITESCIADGSHLLGGVINELRAMGFVIEMDDFGTGYSSLEILKNAPTDVVKIDQAFVRDISRSKFDETFIQIIVTLCHSVGIRVCLEGVETWDAYHLVRPMGLDLIQGYLFGKPQPEREFTEHCIGGASALAE